jgi:hypothetical protein
MQAFAKRAVPALLVVGSILVVGCTAQGAPASEKPEPAHVEEIAGSELKLVTLVPEAAQRLGIATAPVAMDAGTLVVPYGSLIYDPQGGAWVYVQEQPLHFVRHAVTVEVIEGDRVELREGPAVGALVVTTGVAELYGTEFEVGH